MMETKGFRWRVVFSAVSVPARCGDRGITRLAEQVNVGGTRQVLKLAGQLPSRPRVLFVSSSHVYERKGAARGLGAAPKDVCLREDAPVVPATPYGMTKWKAEEAVRHALRDGTADVVVARAFQHTGPRQQEPLMLPQWIGQFIARADGPVEVHTKDAWIDFNDVRDVVRAYALLMEHGQRGEIYNVGSGVNRRTGDLLEILRRLAGPDREIVEMRPGFKQDPVADVSKLSRATGWSPRIDVEQTITDTLSAWSPC